MRPPSSPLHPRSRFTSSLFATTVFASFFVVVLPHVLPCPAPRGAFTDDGTDSSPGTGNGRRRRRRIIVEDNIDAEGGNGGEEVVKFGRRIREDQRRPNDFAVGSENEAQEGEREDHATKSRTKRACPVPKPSGLVGEILGFKNPRNNGEDEASRRREEEPECPVPRPSASLVVGEMLGFKKVSPRNNFGEGGGLRRVEGEGLDDDVRRKEDREAGRPP